MIILLPVSTSQTIKIVPRSYLEDSNVQLKITEDGTRKTETLTGLTATYSGNFIEIPCTFSILSEGKMYYIEVQELVIYCTEIKHIVQLKPTELFLIH